MSGKNKNNDYKWYKCKIINLDNNIELGMTINK